MKGPDKGRFDKLFADGQRVNGKLFRVYSLPGAGSVGFATTRAIGCHARRNRQKRRAREAYNALGLQDVGLDVAVLVKESVQKAGFEEMHEELRRLLEETRRRWADGSVSS